MRLTTAFANQLAQAPKIIDDDMVWYTVNNGRRLKVAVMAVATNEFMELRVYVGQHNRSFTLLYRNLPIRRYCPQGYHRNPDHSIIRGPHKHTWDEQHQDSIAYVPNDIDAYADVDTQIFEFLSEQNITVLGNYQPFS